VDADILCFGGAACNEQMPLRCTPKSSSAAAMLPPLFAPGTDRVKIDSSPHPHAVDDCSVRRSPRLLPTPLPLSRNLSGRQSKYAADGGLTENGKALLSPSSHEATPSSHEATSSRRLQVSGAGDCQQPSHRSHEATPSHSGVGGGHRGREAEEEVDEEEVDHSPSKSVPLERRLLTLKEKGCSFSKSGYEDFKRSHGVPVDTKLFIFNGNPNALNDEVIRDALKERGYVENVWDPDGIWFDIKWGHRHKTNYVSLAPPQLTCHYERDFELCTKSGLASHLRDCSIFADHDSSNFCPPTYHLNSCEQIDHFHQDFFVTKAMCILKSWYAHVKSNASSETFQEGVIRVALGVSRRHSQDIDELLDSDENEAEQPEFIIRRSELEVLHEVELDHPERENLALEHQLQARLERERVGLQGHFLVERQKAELQQQAERHHAREEKEKKQRHKLLGSQYASCHRSSSSPALHRMSAVSADRPSTGSAATRLMPAEAVEAEVQERKKQHDADVVSGNALMEAVLAVLQTVQDGPLWHACTRNIWIMKPAGKLRGQGIFLEDDVDKICRHAQKMKGDTFGSSYVCQQYVENPLLIGGGRKHDIRQWVTITSLNPLTIWFFNECYVRLAANDYTLDDITDRFTHLNNNAIICMHEKYDPADEYWSCQWGMPKYRQLMREKFGSDVYTTKVLPQMKQIIITTMKSVQESMTDVDTHSSCFQLLGYDFLVDEDLRVWLLEVNSNPLMHSTCPVTERLVDPCLRDMFRVVLDGEDGRNDREVQFDLLFKGPSVPNTQIDGSLAHEMFLEGKHIDRPRAVHPEAAASEADQKMAAQKLQARRVQELQDLADKKKHEKDKAKKQADRALRIRTRLRQRIVPKQTSSHIDMGIDLSETEHDLDGPGLGVCGHAAGGSGLGDKLPEAGRLRPVAQSRSSPMLARKPGDYLMS